MPVGDSDYIPRKGWASAAKQWFKDDLDAKTRLEQTQRMLEPLKTAWTDEDRAWLCALRIKVG